MIDPRLHRRAWLGGAGAAVAAGLAPVEAWSLSFSPMRQRERVESSLLDAAGFEGEPVGTRTIADALREDGVPGLSFALIDGGEISWAHGYGVTRAGGEPVDAATIFQAGSIAKPVSAIGALTMRDDGLLDLDRDVQAYLGDFRLPAGKQSAAHPVTLRNLISHTSGITPGGYQGYPVGKPVPSNEVSAKGAPPANSPRLQVVEEPGSTLAYSGGGYTLLEIAMQNVSGLPFEVLMRERVLGRFGLNASTFAQPLPPAFARIAASGHGYDGKAIEGGWMIHPEQAAAGLWSTPSDIARFMIGVRNAYLGRSRVLRRQTARDFLTVQKEDEGLGIIVHGQGDTLDFRHGGGTRGYSCYMIMENVARGRGAVFMTNSDKGQGLGVQMFRAASAVYGWSQFKPAMYRRVTLEPSVLQGLVGAYEFGPDVAVHVTWSEADNRISVVFPNGDAYPMTPVGDRRFVHPRDNKLVAFEGEAGREVMLVDGETGRRP